MMAFPNRPWAAAAIGILTLGWAPAASAQNQPEKVREPVRTRIGLGPQFVPSFPGSKDHSLRPLIDFSRARGDAVFDFEAADESFGFPLLRSGALAIGPSAGFEGKRDAKDVGAALPKVGSTFELGAFVQYQLSEAVRGRVEVRKGLGGHKGLIGIVSADYVTRNRDEWLFSVGPRATFANDRYNQAYFSVTPAAAVASGLPAFAAGGGLQAVGVAASGLHQFSPRWGVYSYGKYDRLVSDAGKSPIVKQLGSRNQFSGGVALTYTFGELRSTAAQ